METVELNYASNIDFIKGDFVQMVAALVGNLETLQWLRSQGHFPWDQNTYMPAERHEWDIENGYPELSEDEDEFDWIQSFFDEDEFDWIESFFDDYGSFDEEEGEEGNNDDEEEDGSDEEEEDGSNYDDEDNDYDDESSRLN